MQASTRAGFPKAPAPSLTDFLGASTARGGDELTAQLGQLGLEHAEMLVGGLVLLRSGHLQSARWEQSKLHSG